MRPVLPLFLLLIFASACRTKPLSKRLVGVWSVEHYEEFGPGGYSTGHALDGLGRLAFGKDGSGQKTFGEKAAKSRFTRLPQFRWSADDSVVTLTATGAAAPEIWLVTKNYSTFMEWVTVEGDSQRVMYLIKR